MNKIYEYTIQKNYNNILYYVIFNKNNMQLHRCQDVRSKLIIVPKQIRYFIYF